MFVIAMNRFNLNKYVAKPELNNALHWIYSEILSIAKSQLDRLVERISIAKTARINILSVENIQ